jgi:zinc transporter ZupT
VTIKKAIVGILLLMLGLAAMLLAVYLLIVEGRDLKTIGFSVITGLAGILFMLSGYGILRGNSIRDTLLNIFLGI